MTQQQFDQIRENKGLAAAIVAYALFILIACAIMTGVFFAVLYAALAF